jgi:hypothetical protein
VVAIWPHYKWKRCFVIHNRQSWAWAWESIGTEIQTWASELTRKDSCEMNITVHSTHLSPTVPSLNILNPTTYFLSVPARSPHQSRRQKAVCTSAVRCQSLASAVPTLSRAGVGDHHSARGSTTGRSSPVTFKEGSSPRDHRRRSVASAASGHPPQASPVLPAAVAV